MKGMYNVKVVLAGAFGNLGAEILKKLVAEGYEVVAAGRREKPVEGTKGRYRFVSIDATKPETLRGLCDGADIVITTLGLTGAAIEHDDDIYLLYNENKANFQATQPQRWTFLYNNMADKCCVVLSKIENGDQLSNKVLYTAQAFPYPQQPSLTSNFEFFSKVLTIDENAVYYLLKHDKEFRIEKISW